MRIHIFPTHSQKGGVVPSHPYPFVSFSYLGSISALPFAHYALHKENDIGESQTQMNLY